MNSLNKKIIVLFIPVIIIRFIAVALSDIFSVMMAICLGDILSDVSEQGMLASSEMIQFGLLFLMSVLICPMLLFLSNKFFLKISIDGEEVIFCSVLNQNPISFKDIDAGKVSSKIIEDGIQLRWAIVDFFVSLLNVVLMVLIIIWFAISIDLLYTTVVLTLALMCYFKSVIFGRLLTKANISFLDATQEIKSKMLEAAASIRFIHINKLSALFLDPLICAMDSFTKREMSHFLSLTRISKFITEFMDKFTYLAILGAGFFLSQHNLISPGTVLTMSSYYILLSKQLSNLDTIVRAHRMFKEVSDDLSFTVNQPFETLPCFFKSFQINSFFYGMGTKSICCPFNITVNKGDKIAIIGENGSGKTTLLNLILGLSDSPKFVQYMNKSKLTKGNLRWLFSYIDMNANPLGDKVCNYILSGTNALSESKCMEIYSSVIESCGLSHLLSQNTDTLSGGERKRVEFARSQIEICDILAIDEPEVGLDTYWKKRMCDIIKKSDQTVIYTSHDPDFVALANKVISINDGIVSLK